LAPFYKKDIMKRTNYRLYTPHLKQRARNLRKDATLGERLLWGQIRRKRLGYRFLRQVPIEHYIVDFYCRKLQMVIEVDGCTHEDHEQFLYDKRRQAYLERLGLYVVRFDDLAVKQEMDVVIDQLVYVIKERVEELGL
jgi:very-short-patch-repair endonuclease